MNFFLMKLRKIDNLSKICMLSKKLFYCLAAMVNQGSKHVDWAMAWFFTNQVLSVKLPTAFV